MRIYDILPVGISIHALREEGDRCGRVLCRWRTISIHALREEGDAVRLHKTVPSQKFLSTPSARRATTEQVKEGGKLNGFLSTPSARRATGIVEDNPVKRAISIHALREEGDGVQGLHLGGSKISIHALREEGDSLRTSFKGADSNFYPRPPRGGRQQKQRQNLYFLINYTTFCTNLEEP